MERVRAWKQRSSEKQKSVSTGPTGEERPCKAAPRPVQLNVGGGVRRGSWVLLFMAFLLLSVSLESFWFPNHQPLRKQGSELVNVYFSVERIFDLHDTSWAYLCLNYSFIMK